MTKEMQMSKKILSALMAVSFSAGSAFSVLSFADQKQDQTQTDSKKKEEKK